MDSISKKMKELRQENGLSFEKLQELTGISRSTLQRYETKGTSNMPASKLCTIADAFDVTPSYLMGWEGKDISWDKIELLSSLFKHFGYKTNYNDDRNCYTLIKGNEEVSISDNELIELIKSTTDFFNFQLNNILNNK